ncbi:MAG: thermonuclease family protein [Bdellovibrionales bacterium]
MKRIGGFGLDMKGLVLSALLLSLATPGLAQVMPPPQKAPRTPVKREALPGKAHLESREVSGPATIIDGDRLQINDFKLRLFGVVPPQLSASYGPQARAALDEMVQGQNVDCRVRDRDSDGRFLATCSTANTKIDLAFELLKRGLAVSARGSLQPTELAPSYLAAEQAAQSQKIGLWSAAPPPPAAAVPAASPAPTAKTDNPNVPPLPSEIKKDEKTVTVGKNEKLESALVMPSVLSLSPPAIAPLAPAAIVNPVKPAVPLIMPTETAPPTAGLFERYQLFITGLVILFTAFGIMTALMLERRRDRRDEMKAIAAALRGELLAARAVCQGRLRTWGESDKTGWPRIRSTLYQAYVGKLGWLGATLARQIASIYGQASDYAAYYNPSSGPGNEPRSETSNKRQALQTLIDHIEEVLPKLARIEQTGRRPGNSAGAPPRPQPPPAFTAPPEPPEPPIDSYPDDAPYANTPTPQNTSPAPPAQPLWNIVKKFAQGSRPENQRPAQEEPMQDYTSLIEEEMARMSSEEGSAQQRMNVPRMRTGS